MKYNFDEIIDRNGTVCEKYDHTEAIFGTRDILPLWIADTDFRTPSFIINALKERLEHPIFGYSFRCNYYYEAVRSWLFRRNGWNVSLDWLDFTPGVVCGLSYGIKSFTEEGDKIVIQPPVYPPFARTIKANKRVVVNNPLKIIDGRYEIDFEDLDQKLEGAKLFILCNPHNPTGRVFTKEELLRIGNLCLKHGVYIVSDEIHSDLILKPNRHIHIASLSEEIANITLTYVAPSKTFNIAGFSTAVAIIPNPELHEMYRNCANQIHVDQGNIFGAVALRAAYNNGDEWLDCCMEYIRTNIEYVLDFLRTNTPKIKCIPPEATFLLWLDFSELGMTHADLQQFLIQKAKLGLNSGTDFGEEGECHMRINVGSPRSVIEQAMHQLKTAYDTL
ncbi:MAG TPA: PatB family C-S lyase [Candidatus Avirikenella pullistercoris]|mgnify:CR=1 FL=1|nr:PatB family C-S lyase [Candidatus Avirikenella pullistercoris]